MPLSPDLTALTLYDAPIGLTLASTAIISIKNCLSVVGIGFTIFPSNGSLPTNFNSKRYDAFNPSGIPKDIAALTNISVNEALNGCCIFI